MDTFLMKPKIDFAFKEIMTDEKARIGFLSAVLKLNPNDIKTAILLNTDLKRLHEDDKQGILDVRILLNDNTEIDIEVQLSKLAVPLIRDCMYTKFLNIICFSTLLRYMLISWNPGIATIN